MIATERRLLEQDDDLLAKILTDLPQFRKPLSEVVAAYESLGLGEFTNEVWKELRSNGGGRYVDKYNEALEDDLKRTGVKNKVLRDVVLKGTDQVVSDLNSAMNRLNNFTPTNYSRRDEKLTKQFISFIEEDEKFSVTEEDKELLLEAYCRIYLDPHEAELYDVLVIAQEAFKELYKIDKKLSLDMNMVSFNVFTPFFREIGPDLKISGQAVKGAYLYKEMKARFGR